MDLRTPIMFRLKLKLDQDEPRQQRESYAVSNINYFPILNKAESMKILKIKFHESCGEDELCHSKLRASLEIGPGFDLEKNVLEVQNRQEINLTVKISNEGEPAYSAELFLNIDANFAYVGRSDDVTDVHCDFRGQGLGVRCRLGNPYASQRTDTLYSEWCQVSLVPLCKKVPNSAWSRTHPLRMWEWPRIARRICR